jgi:hypothetical protein
MISDTLVAEGNGGFMLLGCPTDVNTRFGPFYPDPNRPGDFVYCGSEPRPPRVPEYIQDEGASNSTRVFAPRSVAAARQAALQRVASQYGGTQHAAPQYGGTQRGGFPPN